MFPVIEVLGKVIHNMYEIYGSRAVVDIIMENGNAG